MSQQLRPDGSLTPAPRALAREAPISLVFNGWAHAVMMVTPADLEDFVIGFSYSEDLIDSPADIQSMRIGTLDIGHVAEITIAEARYQRVLERKRGLVGNGACGLCGVIELEHAIPRLAPITARPQLETTGIFRALAALSGHQPEGRTTGAMHAATWVDPNGAICAAREDAGRHVALDKLIGHGLRIGLNPADAAILMSSRCSYELVQKTVRLGAPLLITVSAATDLAVQLAATAGLTLIALARPDTVQVMHDPAGVYGHQPDP